MASAVELRGVHKSFGAADVIRGIDFEVEEGEFVVFVGPSGSGKSTLLRMIAGLETTTSGDIIIDNQNVTFADPSDRGIAMVFQSYALYPHMNVRDNIAFNLKLAGVKKADIDAQVQDAARILRLENLLDRTPAQLSGGQRQRVAIGRAIVRKPKVFLFDEPLSNLDAGLRVQMRLEIERLHRELGATMIYVTHDQVEAMTLADRILALEDGEVRQVGAPLELYHNPTNLFVAGFIGSPKMNLIPGHISDADSSIFLTETDLAISIGKWNGLSGGKMTLGFRPETVEISTNSEYNSAGIPATVAAVERLGNVTYAYLNIGLEDLVTVQLPATAEVKIGENCRITPTQAEMHLFDEAGFAVKRNPSAEK